MFQPAFPGGFFQPERVRAFGILGRLVELEVFFSVIRELVALFEHGKVFLAPVFLEVLQRGAGLGGGAVFFQPDALGGFAAGSLVDIHQAGIKMVVAFPQAENSALAVIEYFLIRCATHGDG